MTSFWGSLWEKGKYGKLLRTKLPDATLYGKSMICPKLMILPSYPVMDFIIILCRHWARLLLSIPHPNLSPKYTFFDWSTHTLTCKGIPLSPRTKSESTISNKIFLLYFFRNENNCLFCYLFIIQPNCFLQLRVIPQQKLFHLPQKVIRISWKHFQNKQFSYCVSTMII